jgi:hypothetical protein
MTFGRIRVGFLDILLGRRVSPGRCMVARAVRRRMADPWGVSVSPEPEGAVARVGAYVPRPFRLWIGGRGYELPEAVSQKIREWDSGKWVWPFSFAVGPCIGLYSDFVTKAEIEAAAAWAATPTGMRLTA